MIDEKKLIEWLKGKKYITVDEKDCLMTEGFEKEHQWELSRNCFINDVFKFIEEQPKVDEWIPCSERLPEDGENVLITVFNDVLNIGWFEVGNNIWRTDDYDCDDEQVNAWMPLPEPYRGDEE